MRAFSIFAIKALLAIFSILGFLWFGINSDYFHEVLAYLCKPWGTNPIASQALHVILSGLPIVLVCDWYRSTSSISKNRWMLELINYKPNYLASFICAICFACLPLISAWATFSASPFAIGGLIPWTDADSYYFGAERILATGYIDYWNQNRPLNATILAMKLALTNGNLAHALLLQSMMFGMAAFFAAYALAQTYGRYVGILMYFLLLVFASIYLPTTMSESLGITIGATSFALLWTGEMRSLRWIFVCGLCMLTLALMARMGAMLILPLLVLYMGYKFKTIHQSFSWASIKYGIVAIAVGILINWGIRTLFAEPNSEGISNGYYVLFAFLSGGKDWPYAIALYPQITNMSEVERSTFIYGKCWEIIRQNPLSMIPIYLAELIRQISEFFEALIHLIFFKGDGISYTRVEHSFADKSIEVGLIIFAFIVGLLRFVWQRRDGKSLNLLTVALLGIFLSLPIFYHAARLRTVAATYPFIAASLAITIMGFRRPNIAETEAKGNSFKTIVPPLMFSVFIIGSAFLATTIGTYISTPVPSISPYNKCPSGQDYRLMKIGPGMSHVEIHPSSSKLVSFTPKIRATDLNISDFIPEYVVLANLPQPTTIFTGYDYANDKEIVTGVAPIGFVGKRTEFRHLCTAYANKPGGNPIYKVMSSEVAVGIRTDR